MQLESHATPARTRPEQRYAQLHRAIEQGMVSDAVWRELAEVSIALGHADEAARCIDRLDDDALREALRCRLRRGGATAPARDDHAVAPAASDAGRKPSPPRAVPEADPEPQQWERDPSLREHLVDAVQFLFVQHMPWLCLLTTLSFPFIVGLGGFLAAGASPLGLAAIAALPGLCVLTLICAMGHRILREGSQGAIDPPGFPDVRELVSEALRWCSAALALALLLGGPIAVAGWFGVATIWLAVATGLAALVAPMSFTIGQVSGLRAALSPWPVLRAVVRGGFSYVGLAVVCWTACAPPALVAWYVLEQPLWIQISVVGPAAVLPVFVVARMLGTWIDTRRHCLGHLLVDARRAAPTAPTAPDERRPPARPARPPAPERPASRTDRPARPRAIEGRGPRRPRQADEPDLRHMPGAVTVSGRARKDCGAAARRS
jgi:hypothetical protein